MGFSNQTTQQQFPYSADSVFAALGKAVEVSNMTIKEIDFTLKRATVNVGMSLLSWGETISVSVRSLDKETCVVSLDSALKFSANLAGSHKHQKNFDKLLYSLSNILSEGDGVELQKEIEPVILKAYSDKNELNVSLIIIVSAFVILGIPAGIYYFLK
ncbi:hypothetical protein [Enterobacter cloacae]|uniref:hypothetical protein n=2 Tax=Enterobacter TaxID=547 RepID=UPI000FEBCE3E|nr:hypothetical protein [Enterobacter cloacae]RWS52664.1 hypothetical protein DN586_22100 [Enterobacter cloacae]